MSVCFYYFWLESMCNTVCDSVGQGLRPLLSTGLALLLSYTCPLCHSHTPMYSCYLPLFVPCPDGIWVFPLLFCPCGPSALSLWADRGHMSQLKWPNLHHTVCLSDILSNLPVSLPFLLPLCLSLPCSCVVLHACMKCVNTKSRLPFQQLKLHVSQLSFAVPISLSFHFPSKRSHSPCPPYAVLHDHVPFWPSHPSRTSLAS